MALPDYSSASSASFGAAPMTRNQKQRERKQERRQDRRTRRITRGWGQEEPADTTDYSQPYVPGDQYEYDETQYPGYQGTYVAPENSYNHPFYTPGASYAQQGQQYLNPSGTDIQKTYIERNPAAGYYGAISQQGYGGLDAKSQTVQKMYQDFATGYEASKAYNNFEGNFRDFMGMQNIPNLLEQMTSQQIGIDRSAFDGRDRWQFRGQ